MSVDDEFDIKAILEQLHHATAEDVVREALREYVGDGEGADLTVLSAYGADLLDDLEDALRVGPCDVDGILESIEQFRTGRGLA